MDILELQVYRKPNIYSLRYSIVKIKVKLGELAEVPTKDIAGLNDRIIQLFPGISDHKCSTGYVGGFVDRLREGTYLAHVTEHLCLELQRMLGYDLKYGKARQVTEDIYHVIYACQNPIIGKACGFFIVENLNRMIQGKMTNFDEDLKSLKNLCMKYDQGPSTVAIVQEAARRGIPVSEVGESGLIRLGYGKYQRYISATLFEGTSSIAVDIACDKSLTKVLLDEVNIPVPEGKACLSLKEALEYAKEIGYPVVIKPKSGNQGKQAFVDILDDSELKVAFEHAITLDKEVMVEKLVNGRDYRILVVNGRVAAAAERIPAHVIGDGAHSVQELIDIINNDEQRGEDHEKPLTKIKIDDHTHHVLRKQGMDLTSIPEINCMVKLKETANLSTGGVAIDRTDYVHPKNREIAELAARSIGLDIAGIDMVIPDISKPMEEGFGAVVEVNAAPGIRMHLYPADGRKRDVISPILDMIYPYGTPFTIPIISITGTNGKTTTTRMIGRILRQNGLTVGMTTTHGIYVNENCIEYGDTTGPRSARRILNDRNVDVAVLETARGGIIREGLAYEKADVAVFTNLSEDHLGIDDIHTMDQLLHVKSLILEAVKEEGTCVLNADDPWVMKASEKCRGNIVLYTTDDRHPDLWKHVKSGGNAIYLKDKSIFATSRGFAREIIQVDEIPATLQGALRHNIYNSMAAIGACFALGTPFDAIKQALSGFSCDAGVNPGRFNIYDLGDFKVILDYGHNIDSYRATIEGLKNLEPERLIGIIGVPGDRRDEDIKRIGELSGKSFDRIIIKEDSDLRGRRPLEVANLLLEGALDKGMSREAAEVIPEEEAALQSALNHAEKGDMIVMFFEKMEPLIQVIEDFKNRGHRLGMCVASEGISVN